MTLRNRKVHSAGGGLDSGCHESLLPTGGEDEAHPVDNHLDDVVLLERLRTKCEIEPGAMDDSAHDELLGRIWDTAYPTEPFVCPSQRWKELGFQVRHLCASARAVQLAHTQHTTHLTSHPTFLTPNVPHLAVEFGPVCGLFFVPSPRISPRTQHTSPHLASHRAPTRVPTCAAPAG